MCAREFQTLRKAIGMRKFVQKKALQYYSFQLSDNLRTPNFTKTYQNLPKKHHYHSLVPDIDELVCVLDLSAYM